MSLADELLKLEDMRARGSLSEREFEQAKARLLEGASGDSFSSHAPWQAVGRMRRSSRDRWVAGVCGGLSQFTQVDSWIWRLLFAALLFFGGAGLVAYVLLWVFVPAE